MGDKGCWVGSGDTLFLSPAFKANVIDTTGAGDLFASGFLYGYLKGFSLKTCAYFGNLVGKSIVEVTGAELPDDACQTLRVIIVLQTSSLRLS